MQKKTSLVFTNLPFDSNWKWQEKFLYDTAAAAEKAAAEKAQAEAEAKAAAEKAAAEKATARC